MIKELINSTAGLKKWLKLEDSGDHLSVFATTPRHFPNNRWEPVLIGKGQELPLLDERLLLEGVKVSYRVGLVVWQLGFVDLDLRSSPWLVGHYCSYLLPKQDGGIFQI